MSRRMGYALASLLGVLAPGQPARAAVDINGPWAIAQWWPIGHKPPGLFLGSCIWDVAHSGTFIEITTRTCTGLSVTRSYSGTIDTAARTFVATEDGQTPVWCRNPTTVEGTIAPDSRSFRGTIRCEGSSFPVPAGFEASKCGNEVIDPGEACDPPWGTGIGCCSGCKPLPAGTWCSTGDGPCTERRCDGRSGLCPATPTPRPAGSLCSLNGTTCEATACDGAGNCNVPSRAPDGYSCQSPCYEKGFGRCRSGACVARRLPDGAPCAWDIDGNACTVDRCDAAGTCIAGPCSACCDDSGGTCQPSYDPTCRPPGVSTMSKLALGGNRGTLAWMWAHGDDRDFNDPAANGATLCLYAGPSKNLLTVAEAPGGTCGSRPCWSRTSSGRWRYRGRQGDGLYGLALQEYGTTTARILARGRKMTFLDWYSYPNKLIPLPVHAQLKVGGRCWESTFPVAERTEQTFVAPGFP